MQDKETGEVAQEEERHRCECREWMRRRLKLGKDWLRGVLQDIERKRGAAACQRLRDDIAQQWKLGNRGDYGDWR